MRAWMPLSYTVPVNPELPILRFISLASNYCSVNVQQTFLFHRYLFLFVWEGGWYFYHVFWFTPTFTLCMRCMSYENFIGNQALMNHTVLFKLHKMSGKLCTSNSRSTNMKFLTYLVFGHPNWIFLLLLNFVYYPWVPIVHGARRDYSWNNNVKCKVMFTLYRTDFRTATKSHPVSYEHLSDMRISTLEIGAAQLRSVTEIAPKSRFLCVNRNPIQYGFRAGAKAVWYHMNTYPICGSPL